MDRRSFFKLVSACAACGFVAFKGPKVALAGTQSASGDVVQFSPDVAMQIAENFMSGVSLDKSLVVSDPIFIYDTSGSFTGYQVPFLKNGQNHGYVILDYTYEGLVSSYSFNDSAVGPAGILNERLARSSDSISNYLVKLNPLEYAVPDYSRGQYLLNSNGTLQMDNIVEPQSVATGWDDVTIYFDDAVADYTVGYGGSVGVYFYQTEAAIKAALKKYACGPTALFSIGLTMRNAAGNGPLISSPTSWDDYNSLWSYTATTVYRTANGISYGSTQNDRLGPGFVNYCKLVKGKAISSTYNSSPSYAAFVSHINQGKFSLIHMGINNGSEVGHVMAVYGHSQLLRNGQSSPLLNCLEVFTGWNEPAFLNFDPSKYRYVNATFFS